MPLQPQKKTGQLQQYTERVAYLGPKRIRYRTSPSSGSAADIRRLKIYRSSGGTSKTAVIALRKFRQNGGTTNCTMTPTQSSERPITSGADSLPMWISL